MKFNAQIILLDYHKGIQKNQSIFKNVANNIEILSITDKLI